MNAKLQTLNTASKGQLQIHIFIITPNKVSLVLKQIRAETVFVLVYFFCHMLLVKSWNELETRLSNVKRYKSLPEKHEPNQSDCGAVQNLILKRPTQTHCKSG